MRLSIEVLGVPEAAAGIEIGYARTYAAATRQMGISMLELRNYTVSAHLHGPTGDTTLQQRTGNLARNIASEVVDDGNGPLGLVGVPEANTAPYARILALGGTTRAHVIEAREAKSLAFMAGGAMIFRRKVNHPGSKFPARNYLAAARDEQIAQIRADLTEAILGANA